MAAKPRQHVVTRLSDFERQLPHRPRPKNRRKVRQIYLPLPFSRGVLFSLRRFKTNKKSRSKKYKQLVIGLPFLPVKEIAIRRISPKKLPKDYRILGMPRRLAAVILTLLILCGIGGSIYFGLQLRKPSQIDLTNRIPAPTLSHPVSASQAKTLPRSEPVRLRIDKIQIDAGVSTIGKNADGTIEVPADYTVTGWYKFGPTPGELGPAAIVGHVDNVNGIAVFWRLRELQAGDIIEVDRADGKTAKFKVDNVKEVPQDNFPTQEVTATSTTPASGL